MLTTLISLTVIGLLVGFAFSMPTAGPISILVISYTLHDNRKRALFTAIGGATVDFLYIFIVVFGFTKLFIRYKWSITYILLLGSIFIFILAYKLWNTRLHLTDENEKGLMKRPLLGKVKKHDGFFTGFIVNLLNPTLFMGWLVSSFIVLSFAASNGINVGGMENMFFENVEEIKNTDQPIFNSQEQQQLIDKFKSDQDSSKPNLFFQILNSLDYSASVAVGTVIWFYILTGILHRHKEKIPIQLFNHLIRALAVFMFLIAGYLLFDSVRMMLSG
ncbi:MAG: LysE family transporter [Calditrichaeota bacterium]|nr:LysE family transporter [Calditrichota bacterium]